MDDDIRTYELRFYGGGPGEDWPGNGVFDTQKALIKRLEEVDNSDFGPLSMGVGEVIVYQGGDVDPMVGTNTVIGKIDGQVALIKGRGEGGFVEADLDSPI